MTLTDNRDERLRKNEGSSMHDGSCIGINYAHRFPKCFRSLHTLLGFLLCTSCQQFNCCSCTNLFNFWPVREFLVEIHTAKMVLWGVVFTLLPWIPAPRTCCLSACKLWQHDVPTSWLHHTRPHSQAPSVFMSAPCVGKHLSIALLRKVFYCQWHPLEQHLLLWSIHVSHNCLEPCANLCSCTFSRKPTLRHWSWSSPCPQIPLFPGSTTPLHLVLARKCHGASHKSHPSPCHGHSRQRQAVCVDFFGGWCLVAPCESLYMSVHCFNKTVILMTCRRKS